MMRSIACCLLTFSLIGVPAAQQPAAPARPADESWPPPGVHPAKESGVTLPRLLHEVRPQYTAAAMREKIEGKVALECVVETDGTVARVRVARSLDKLYGLDDQAITAAKQWRFTPGTKDGAAVPVLVTIELTFVLRGSPPGGPPPAAQRAFTWPEPFTPADSAANDSASWTEDLEDVSGLQIRVAYPGGWILRKGGPPAQLLTIQSVTARGSRLLVVQNPRPARFDVGQGVSTQALQRLADAAGQNMTTPAGAAKVMGIGQARAGDQVWLWYDLQMPTFDPRQLPPGLNTIAVDRFDTARLWTFVTTAGAQEVIVSCVALHPRGMSEADTPSDLQQAGAEFEAMLKRVSIHVP